MVERGDGTKIPIRKAILADGSYQGITSGHREGIPKRRKEL